tara:strand:- start:3898 stop:3999 length:102 start_codon:yes stop_codon:yes gene_type:complete
MKPYIFDDLEPWIILPNDESIEGIDLVSKTLKT